MNSAAKRPLHGWKNKTVWAKQYGRLGNNLFQKAAAIGYATKHTMDYSLCGWFASGWANNSPQRRMLIKEAGHQYVELAAPTKEYVVLDGYWQSERYFAHCREEVLKALGFKALTTPTNCSIHVRRGDYLKYPDKHPVVTAEYLNKAISYMIENTNARTFIFFSDDMEWCKKFVNYELPQRYYDFCDWTFSEGRSEREDMELMSWCEHNIISNSTFSWWGAYLNQNPNKVVISPSKDNWFGPGNANLCTDDIIPESWIQIKY
jgi:hypothetical protein